MTACSREASQATLHLKNGDTFSGTLASRDANSVTIVTPAGEAKTFLTRQIASVNLQKKAPETISKNYAPTSPLPSNQKTSGKRTETSDEPRPFNPPASGKLTIPAGTVLTLRLREVLDGADTASNTGSLIRTIIVDDIQADETAIPANSPLNLWVVNKPGSGGREIVCSLSAMFLGQRPYAPEKGAYFGGQDPLLGSINAQPKDNLPPAARELPLRLPFSSVVQFKLTAPLSIREAK